MSVVYQWPDLETQLGIKVISTKLSCNVCRVRMRDLERVDRTFPSAATQLKCIHEYTSHAHVLIPTHTLIISGLPCITTYKRGVYVYIHVVWLHGIVCIVDSY